MGALDRTERLALRGGRLYDTKLLDGHEYVPVSTKNSESMIKLLRAVTPMLTMPCAQGSLFG